jgi:hypothetical protein
MLLRDGRLVWNLNHSTSFMLVHIRNNKITPVLSLIFERILDMAVMSFNISYLLNVGKVAYLFPLLFWN